MLHRPAGGARGAERARDRPRSRPGRSHARRGDRLEHHRPSRDGTPASHEHRLVYDCRHETRLPGTLRRREAQPPCDDADVNRAYDAAGTTYEFYRTVFGRDSLDAHGKHLISSVHYGEQFCNARWDGAQMIYGDGDGVMFRPFTLFLDVIARELTHGVIYNETNLGYEGEAGALNESLADMFGTLVKQWAHHQAVHEADWLIVKGLFRPPIHAKALRSLAAPGSAFNDKRLGLHDTQPSHMRHFVTDPTHDPVHANSGIPNHAFYLFATARRPRVGSSRSHLVPPCARDSVKTACSRCSRPRRCSPHSRTA